MSTRMKLLAAVVALAGVVGATYFLPLGDWALRLVEYVRGAGMAGVIVYGLVYALAAVLFIPGSILTIGAGFVWGVGGGFLLVWPASTTGALLAFLLGRSVARDWVSRKVEASRRLEAVDEAVGENSFKVIALLRLSPLVPFSLLNYVLGVTRARFGAYFAATGIAMIPGILLYVYLGSLITNAAAIASGERPDAGIWQRVFFWGGLVATAVVTVLISRLAKKKLERETEIDEAIEEEEEMGAASA